MGQSFKDSERYAPLHTDPQGPGDARPTSLQILEDNDAIGQFNNKVFLVTGGSNGLGIDEVKVFAKAGAHVFFTSRDLPKGERVRDEILKELKSEQSEVEPRIEVIKMDLLSFDSVRKAAAEFRSRTDKLNVLVNNAGGSRAISQ
jgi:NAD(P)-dependent dehydrogenase (short-subunit alcohol dehydrogenase family)